MLRRFRYYNISVSTTCAVLQLSAVVCFDKLEQGNISIFKGRKRKGEGDRSPTAEPHK